MDSAFESRFHWDVIDGQMNKLFLFFYGSADEPIASIEIVGLEWAARLHTRPQFEELGGFPDLRAARKVVELAAIRRLQELVNSLDPVDELARQEILKSVSDDPYFGEV